MLFVVLELYGQKVSDNASAEWLIESFDVSNHTFIMRENRGDEKGIVNLHSFRKILHSRKKIINLVKQSEKIWFRLPSPKVLLVFILAKNHLKHKSVYIHFCANRMTYIYLKSNFSTTNLFRFIYGIFVKLYFRNKKDFIYYYTGSHVKNNFNLSKDSKFIIDQVTLKLSQVKGSGNCYFGRFFKLNDPSFLNFLNNNKISVDCYGSGVFPESKNLINKGLLPSEKVMLTLNQYEGIIFPGHEYFEGFPRVLYQAIILKKKIYMHSASNFIDDIMWYEGLNFYDKKLKRKHGNKLDLKKLNAL